MSQRIYLVTAISVACLHIRNWGSYNGVLMESNMSEEHQFKSERDGSIPTQWAKYFYSGENEVASEGDVTSNTQSVIKNNVRENQLASEGDVSNLTQLDKYSNIEENQAASEGNGNTPNKTHDDKDENMKVASEGDLRDANEVSNDSNEIDQIASDGAVESPTASPADEWAKLWKNNIEVHSNSSEKVLGLELQNILKSYNATLTPTSAKEKDALKKLFDVFPVPKDSIALYNEDAYNQLVSKLLLSQTAGREFKIVATGGSTSAGGGRPSVAAGERYFGRFVDYLKNLLSINTGIEYVDEGHGTRNSLHAATFFDEFIPPDADLLIWEFSINDAADPDLKNKPKILDTARQSFIAWLHEVNNIENPPLVMLVYYWDAPFHRYRTKNRQVVANSFESHGDIARQFDFVVGHANMAAYIDELKLPDCGNRKCIFLSDKHHASKLGHTATAFALLNVLSPHVSVPPSASNQTISSNATHLWECGVETEAKQVLKNVITNSSSGWRSSIGSWTLEIPFVAQRSSERRLVPAQQLNEIEMLGKESPIRIDRQRVTSLGFCSGNSFSLKAPSKPMKNVRVMFLSFQSKGIRLMKTESIQVQINGSNSTVPGELVPMVVSKAPEILPNWPCHFACTCGWGINVDLYWYVFESTQPVVHSVSLCATSAMRKPPKIQSIAFW